MILWCMTVFDGDSESAPQIFNGNGGPRTDVGPFTATGNIAIRNDLI